ncbi:hypothetical protein N7533_011526 [Penicillium manginii]|uniref:uncharacterized protein n=1 Tax=Penicillium manginii TaxID=203109 RepID=UPI0025490506|nr:uncharacterized protein N7533_011526 [Penicillium manginii]KAJ5742117.1 hypothetical protein N7533_011526 [Penicillium manginii]
MASSTSDYAAYVTNTDFIGWDIAPTPTPVICLNSGVWTTSGSFGDCSSTSGQEFATSCYQGSSLVRGSNTEACGVDSTCDYQRIFSTTGQDARDAKTRYGCVSNFAANNIYRTLPSQWLATTTSGEASTSSSTTSSSSTETSAAASSNSSSSGISGVAIAGIVVGCVAAGVIIALALVFRRRLLACCGYSKNMQVKANPSWSPMYEQQNTQGAFQSQQQHSYTRPQPLEISAQREPRELGDSRVSRPVR